MFFAFLTFGVLVFTLISRAKRGERISVKPRKWERMSVIRLKGKTFHFHHSYWGIIILPLSYIWGWWMEVSIALIISDILFHIVAHFYWNDPLWD